MSDELENFGRKPNASFLYFPGVTKENYEKSDDRQCTGWDFHIKSPEQYRYDKINIYWI
jgi:hypothetical protein